MLWLPKWRDLNFQLTWLEVNVVRIGIFFVNNVTGLTLNISTTGKAETVMADQCNGNLENF